MIYTAELTNAIYAVESSNDARLSGLIIEHYLLQKLRAKLTYYGYSDVQTGWIIQKVGLCSSIEEPAEDEHEHWYRLMHPGTTLSAVDQAVINTFSQAGRRFFSVEYSPQPLNISSIAVTLTVNEICPHGKSLPTGLSVPPLQKNLNQYLSKYQNLNTRSGSLSKWFHQITDNELESVFIQRCIMNSMSNCIDIDAIALCKNNKELTFYEFKRKYPIRGARKFTDKFSTTFQNVANVVLNTTPKINNYNNSLGSWPTGLARTKMLSMQLDKLLPSNYIKKYTNIKNVFCCGLDWSHYQILNMCNNVNVTYKYLVWNFDPNGIVKASKKSAEYEAEILDYLLIPNPSNNKQNSFLHATLNGSDTIGLTFTEGSNSGALSTDVRLQMVFLLTKN